MAPPVLSHTACVKTRSTSGDVGVFKRVTSLDVLKGIGRNLLTIFLDAFAHELAIRQITPPSQSLGDTDFFRAAANIFSSPENLSESMTQTLRALASMTARAPPPNPYSQAQPRYALRKGLGVWHLTFDWREAQIRHERGMLSTGYLLLNPPPQPLHALDLLSKVPEIYRKQLGIAQITDANTGQARQLDSHARIQERSLALDDAETMRALLRRERELEAILDSDESEPVKAEALRDLEAIAEFQRSHGRRSRDAAQRAGRTVRQAITRLHRNLLGALDTNGKPHPVLCPFSLHILNYILIPSARYSGHGGRHARADLASRFTYEPPPGCRWTD